MGTPSANQEQIRNYFQTAFGGMFPFGSTLEEMGKQNLAMFERAMRMFSPSVQLPASGNMTEAPSKGAAATEEQEAAAEAAFTPSSNIMPIPSSSQQQAVSGDERWQNKIAALQRQLSDLAKNKA